MRLLVPGTVDVFGVGAMSRAGFRALLEGGVRIFEWNGVMIHAKTAVADGRWARVGSTNANITSWFGNWELDVAIEDEQFGAEMQAMFERDLAELDRGRAQVEQAACPERGPVEGRTVERRRTPRMEEWRTAAAAPGAPRRPARSAWAARSARR